MTREGRTIAVIEEIHDSLVPLQEALSDDGLEDYADTVQDTLDRINNLLYVLSHKEIPLGV